MNNKILLTLLICTILMTTLVSAAFLPTEDFDKDVGQYGQYKIKDWWGLSRFQDIELLTNTEVCKNSLCQATKEIIMHQDGILINDKRFYDLKTGKLTQIKSSKFYIVQGNEKIPYKLGTEVKEGIYQVLHEGELYPFQEVDWQILIGEGKYWTEKWAVWSSGLSIGLTDYFKFDETTGNFTANSIRETINMTTADTGTEKWVSGIINNGYNSSFNSDRVLNMTEVAVAQLNHTNKANWSISFWISPTSNGAVSGNEFFQSGLTAPRIYTGMSAGTQIIWVIRDDATTTRTLTSVDHLPQDEFSHVVINYGGEGGAGTIQADAKLYINGTLASTTGTGALGAYTGFATQFIIGKGLNNMNGTIDEVGLWNRTLTVAEISDLYNGGLGISFSLGPTLNSPANNLKTLNRTIDFNSTATTGGAELSNVSLYHNETGTFHRNLTIDVTGTENTSVISQNLTTGSVLWNIEACDIGGICNFAPENFTLNLVNVVVNSETFNTSVLETDSETYIINVSANDLNLLTAANLIWNGTSFAATKSDNIWTRTIDIPTGTNDDKSFHWSFTYAGSTILSDSNTVSINNTNFSFCGGEGGGGRFLNISFQDEADLSQLNASLPLTNFTYYLGSGTTSKTFEFINTTDNFDYNFCAFPNRTLNVLPNVQYKQGTIYPQRIWAPIVRQYTNVTTDQTLYLLNAIDGIFVTFQVINPSNQVLPGVDVTAVRSIGGSDFEVGTGVTGDAGTITFFLNPDFTHIFTFNKTGFTSLFTSFAPTQSSYTITLGGSTAAQANDYTKGITSSILPSKSTELFNDTIYSFNLTLASSFWDVTQFGITLKMPNGTILQSTIAATNGGVLNLNQNTSSNKQIVMDYFWVIDGNFSNRTTYWNVMNSGNTDWSILRFFTDLTLYLNSDLFGLDDFGRYLIIFLIIFLGVGIMSFKFGLVSPISIASIVFGVIFFFDVAVGLLPNPVGAIPNFPTFIAGLILVALIFKEVTR